MLFRQFFGQNIHFVISLLMALAAFAVFWLIFDAWSERKQFKELLMWAGFLLISLGFLLYAAVINQSGFGQLGWNSHLDFISEILRLIGYISIVVGQILNPLQAKPETKGIEQIIEEDSSSSDQSKNLAVGIGLGTFSWLVLLPLGSLAVAVVYWRRATSGLERHLKPVAIAFVALTSFEIFTLAANSWLNTTNPLIYPFVSAFGYFWIIAQISLLISAIVLFKWVWAYLVKRLHSQLFIIFTTGTAIIFSIATISFSFLLMSSVQQSSVTNLNTASQVLNQSLISKGDKTLSEAEILAENPGIVSAVTTASHSQIASLTGNFLVNHSLTSFEIVTSDGEVLFQGANPTRYGQSISSDPLFEHAVLGSSTESKVSQQGVIAPTVLIEAATPIRDTNGNIIGVAITEDALDNSFLDGIYNSTNLSSAIYAGNIRSASSFVASDGTSRSVGITEPSAKVKQAVFNKGQTFSGSLSILNRSYIVVYSPLKDVNNNIIGMILTAQPQQAVLKTIAHSIELTFLIAVIMLLVMVYPAYLLAKRMAKQFQ